MSFYPRTNFAKANLTGTLPTISSTSISLEAGKGALFPDADVAGSFPAVIWNWTDYPDPSDDPNVEVVLVTAITDDTLTIVRAQEDTNASAHNTSGKTYRIALVITAAVIQQLIDAINTKSRNFSYQPTAPTTPADGDLWVDTSVQLDLPVTSADITSIVALTQAEYDALTPVATTLYVITD